MGDGRGGVGHSQQAGGPAVGVDHEGTLPIAHGVDAFCEGPRLVEDHRGLHDLAHVDDPALIHVLDELGHVSVCRFGEDFLGRPDLDHLAVAEDADPVADAQGFVQVVGDEHDRLVELVLDRHQLVLHLAPDQWIQCAEGLIHEQDLRVGAQRPSETHTLLHASGQLAGGVEGVGLEPDHGQCLDGRLVAFFLIHTLDLQAVGGVVNDIAVGEEGKVLEDHGCLLAAEGLEGGAPELLDVCSLDQDTAMGHVVQLVHRSNGRRLARSGQSHDHEDLTLLYLERDVTHPDDVAGLSLDLVLADARRAEVKRPSTRVRAEDLVNVLQCDDRLGVRHATSPGRGTPLETQWATPAHPLQRRQGIRVTGVTRRAARDPGDRSSTLRQYPGQRPDRSARTFPQTARWG